MVLTAIGENPADPTENLQFYNTEMENCTEEYRNYVVEQLEDAKNSAVIPSFLWNSGSTSLLGKTKFSEFLSDLVEKPQGKPTLVPETDKCPALTPAKDDFKEE